MDTMTSGEILKQARERKGYQLDEVARRLRIRPDIVRAIERGDFQAMPPRGYSRNMINAYARFLGLNPTEIVEKYLDEAYANQVSRARTTNTAVGTGSFSIGHNTRIESSRENRRERARAREEDQREEARATRQGTLGRRVYDDRTEYARNDYGHGRDASMNGQSFESSHRGGYSNARYRELASVHRGTSARSGSRRSLDPAYGNMYKGPAAPNPIMSKLPIILVIVLVVVIVVVVLTLLFGQHGSTSSTDVSTLPVSGISDTTGEDDAKAEEETQAKKVAPSAAVVSYCVTESGDSCYVEIYTDGEMTDAETLTDTKETVVNVTGTWTITTYRPDSLSLKVDGKAVTLESDEDYGGMYAYTVDFNEILNQWNIDNGVYASAASSSSSSSSTSTSSSSSSAS